MSTFVVRYLCFVLFWLNFVRRIAPRIVVFSWPRVFFALIVLALALHAVGGLCFLPLLAGEERAFLFFEEDVYLPR